MCFHSLIQEQVQHSQSSGQETPLNSVGVFWRSWIGTWTDALGISRSRSLAGDESIGRDGETNVSKMSISGSEQTAVRPTWICTIGLSVCVCRTNTRGFCVGAGVDTGVRKPVECCETFFFVTYLRISVIDSFGFFPPWLLADLSET